MLSESIITPDYPDFEEFGGTPCSEVDPESFFSVDSPDGNLMNKPSYPLEREAKILCHSCPYQLRCLEYSLKNPDLQGIWGGTTENERKGFRRGKPVRMRIPPIKHN